MTQAAPHGHGVKRMAAVTVGSTAGRSTHGAVKRRSISGQRARVKDAQNVVNGGVPLILREWGFGLGWEASFLTQTSIYMKGNGALIKAIALHSVPIPPYNYHRTQVKLKPRQSTLRSLCLLLH